MTRIISRAEWGARLPTKPITRDDLPWPRLWLHHSVGRIGGAAEMRSIQRDHQSRGWRDIAYNIAVGADGIYEGIGIGNRHLNSDAGGSGTILLLGNFEDNPPPESMIDHTAWLVAHGVLAGWWSDELRDDPHLSGGHRDIPGANPTACPGRYAQAAIPEINRRAAQMIHNLAAHQEVDHVIPGFATTAWAWARERGIVTAKTPAEERPNDPVTRAEVVTMLHRLAEGQTETPPGFAVGAYRRLGDLIERPRPDGLVTEARFITILDRLVKKVTGS